MKLLFGALSFLLVMTSQASAQLPPVLSNAVSFAEMDALAIASLAGNEAATQKYNGYLQNDKDQAGATYAVLQGLIGNYAGTDESSAVPCIATITQGTNEVIVTNSLLEPWRARYWKDTNSPFGNITYGSVRKLAIQGWEDYKYSITLPGPGAAVRLTANGEVASIVANTSDEFSRSLVCDHLKKAQ